MIFHKKIGDGATKAVVIPGWFGDHRAYEPMFDYLDVRRFSYAFIDIRGYGHSREQAGDYTMAEIAADTIALAELAGIGLCIEWHACWMEAGLKTLLQQAIPMTGLVQVSDYVLGDRTAPCRAVPGDGVIPLDRILGDVLEAGYQGVFDIELVGPRIAAEGAPAATQRAAQAISEILTRLGA